MARHAAHGGLRILLLLTLPLCLFAPAQAVDIDDPFTVRLAYTGIDGSCTDKQYSDLQNAFGEAFAMANSALSAIKTVKDSQRNWFGDSSARAATLQVLFAIKPTGIWGKISGPDLQRLDKVESVYKELVKFSTEKHQDQFFVYCNDDWIKYDPGSQMFRAPDHNNIAFSSMTVKPCSNKFQGGFTTHEYIHQITHCPNAFNGFPWPSGTVQWKPSLEAIKNDQSQIPKDALIDSYKSLSGHFLHEMTHLLQDRVKFAITDQAAVDSDGKTEPNGVKAYGYGNGYFLAKSFPDLAVGNADNYHFFALAMYFDTVDFATGAAKEQGKRTRTNAAVQDYNKAAPLADVASPRPIKNAVSPTETDPGNVDPDIPVDTQRALTAKSMINAMTKTEIETPKMVPVVTGQAMDADEQNVLQEL